MPWIKSKTSGENIKHLEGTEEEVAQQFDEFLDGQRQLGLTVEESKHYPGEWTASGPDGFDTFYVDWP